MNRLAEVAKQEAGKYFHGEIMGTESNIHEIVELFPKWSVEEADAIWCAAFVLYCCKKSRDVHPIQAYRVLLLSCGLSGIGAMGKSGPSYNLYIAR